MNYQKMAQRITPLVHALAEGKTLQFRGSKSKGMWEDVYSEGLHFYEDYEYRVKPQSLKEWREQVLNAVQCYTMACIEVRTVRCTPELKVEANARHDKLVALLNNIPKED